MNYVKNWGITLVLLCTSFLISLFLDNTLHASALVPAVFILGIFLTSLVTDGYIYGIFGTLISVLAVNYAFTFPYFKFNFSIRINLISALIMFAISFITCALTARVKKAESIKAESEKEKMRANLLRAVSHDLRTPLTAIYSAGCAMQENKETLSEQQKDRMIQGICEDAQWLNRLVENLLSITRLDDGTVKIIKTPTALDELIDSVLVKFKKRYPHQKVDISLPDEFVILPIDALLIEQVLLNLLENAVQHAKGMQNLWLKVYTSPEKAVFTVRDDGCGINKERIKTIFAGSYAQDETLDASRSHAGIGLSVCATIIRAHGGEIHAENTKKGAMFHFVLNLEDEYNEQQI